jgi:hypothetical protein
MASDPYGNLTSLSAMRDNANQRYKATGYNSLSSAQSSSSPDSSISSSNQASIYSDRSSSGYDISSLSDLRNRLGKQAYSSPDKGITSLSDLRGYTNQVPTLRYNS